MGNSADRKNIVLCDQSYSIGRFIDKKIFVNDSGERQGKKVIEILEEFGFRAIQEVPAEFNSRLVRAQRLMAQSGNVVVVKNSVVCLGRYNSWFRGLEVQSLGSPTAPARCVIESELESNEDDYRYGGSYHRSSQTASPLPYIRLFSLETKSYVYADVDDVEIYEFDTDAISRLHIPGEMHNVIRRVFETPVEDLFGDLLNGKHGGIVVLASGNPGVGKTLTAEIYAESSARPLYVLELGELGTSANEVEEKLQNVFRSGHAVECGPAIR